MLSASGHVAHACIAWCLQGMDDQALEVLKAAKATEEVLAGRAESLAAVRTEYERKQKEVPPQSSPLPLAFAF